MRILIVAPIFSPSNRIAAIRLTKFAKYLQRFGHEVTVIMSKSENTEVEDAILKQDVKDLTSIIALDNSRRYYAIYRFVYGAYKKGSASSAGSVAQRSSGGTQTAKSGIKSFIKQTVRRWMGLYKDHDFAKQAKRYLKKNHLAVDSMLSTYGPFSGHLIGLYYKKKHPQVQWVADFRDIVEFIWEKGPAGFFAKRFLRKTAKHADTMICVSDGVQKILSAETKSKILVINNGYDGEDTSCLSDKGPHSNPCLQICYSGAVYGLRDISPLFHGIHALAQAGEIDLGHVQLHYAGGYAAEVDRLAAQYKLEDIIVHHGFIPRQESLQLQRSSDILLLASWNTPDEQGILTGKFLEYIMHKKPVISLVSGSVPNSELKRITQEANLGFCYEEAAKEEDMDGLKAYLAHAYHAVMNNQPIQPNIREECLEKYSYAELSRQVEKLLRS